MRNISMLTRLAPRTWLAGLLALSACGNTAGEDAEPAPVDAVAEDGTPLAPLRMEIRPDTLQPVIQTVGEDGVVPERLTFHFLPDVAPADRSVEGTVVRVEPDVPGTLSWVGDHKLVFTPERPFAAETRYHVTLDAVATREGVQRPPAGEQWALPFETPEQRFVRMSPEVYDPTHGTYEVRLVFAAAVDVADVRKHGRFTAYGQPFDGAQLREGASANEVIARLQSPRLREAGELAFETDGERWPRSRDARRILGGGAPFRIEAVRLVEGSAGFGIDIVCDDPAVTGKRDFYDATDGRWYYVSTRCELDEASIREAISLSPKVPLSVTATRGGFRIDAELARGTTTLRIDGGARTVDGSFLGTTLERELTVPARSPLLGFVSKGRYLPPDAWKRLPLRHRNVGEARVTVRHVREDNLVFWMSGEDEAATARTADRVLDTTVPLSATAADAVGTTSLDLQALLPDARDGLYEVTVEASGARDVSRILLTDLNLVVKAAAPAPGSTGSPKLHVWALDMDTARPVTGVDVQAVKPSGTVVALCRTTHQGGCTLDLPQDEVDPTPAFAVLAKKGGDLTYLKLDELRTDLSEAKVHGLPYLDVQPYRAAVYGDRGVYRPGDTAHVAGLIRDGEHRAPAGVPVELQLVDPRGKTVRRTTVEPNAAGLFTWDLSFGEFATTGRYRVEALVGKREVGRFDLAVEEFVPERLKVEASVEGEAYDPATEVPVDVVASYLFGGSASGSRYEVSCRLVPSTFRPARNGQYTYGRALEEGESPKPVPLGLVTGELDAEGKGTLACPALGSAGSLKGPARLVADVAVYEAGSGRTTVDSASVPVHPTRHYVGLQTGAKKVASGDAIPVSGVLVDWEGKPVGGVETVEVELFRLVPEYGWYWDEESHDERWQRMLRPISEGRTTVPVRDGKFEARPVVSGAAPWYQVVVRAGEASSELRVEGSQGGYWWSASESRVDQTPRPLQPTALTLAVPDAARVGEPVEVGFDAPYGGRVLLTVETHEIVEQEWVDVKAGRVDWRFTLQDFAPNVYVSALLVKDPHLDSAEAWLPDRAFGVTSIRVEPTAFTQALTLKAPEEVRSNGKLTVELDVGPTDGPTFVTVAAVDEGILSLTDFETPDPFAQIFPDRALGVETFETIGWSLVIPPAGPSSRHGGDAEGALSGRVQSVKPVALWSGPVEVGSDGKARVSFDVPQYRGALRVMAVSASPTRMGRAEATVRVADPIVVQTTLPRFLVEGDTFEIPVFLTNRSGRAREVEVSLTAEALAVRGVDLPGAAVDPIAFLGAPQGRVTLADGESRTVVFHARATGQLGAATFRVTARSDGGLESREELDVPFAPQGPKTREVKRVALQTGEMDLSPLLDGWVPTTETTTFWVTASPYGESFSQLEHVIRYPYGCLEQTTSSTRPLLFVGNLLRASDPTVVPDQATLDDTVRSGIQRLATMQTPSGGFAYWQGGTEPNYWGTAYATHLLLDAERAGYEVPDAVLSDAVRFIEEQLAQNRDSNDAIHGYAFRMGEAYLHYVMALAGKPQKARVLDLVKDGEAGGEAASERQYLLKAALWLAGDRRYEADLKAVDTSALSGVRSNGPAFWSDLRERGLVLSVYQDLFGEGDDRAEALAGRVASGLSKERASSYSTQEIVWGVTGLGKRVQMRQGDFPAPALSVDGKQVAADASEVGPSWTVGRASERDDLKLAVQDADGLFLVVTSEGVREGAAWQAKAEGLAVDREFVNADGTPLDWDAHALGDLVYTKVRIRNTGRRRVENVALVDRVPAGWEIENPRLGRGGEVDWLDVSRVWTMEHMNLRDDRIEVFGGLEPGEVREVVYAVRAVTAGTFTMPPVQAEAMYDPSVRALAPGRTVTIRGPWADYRL